MITRAGRPYEFDCGLADHSFLSSSITAVYTIFLIDKMDIIIFTIENILINTTLSSISRYFDNKPRPGPRFTRSTVSLQRKLIMSTPLMLFVRLTSCDGTLIKSTGYYYFVTSSNRIRYMIYTQANLINPPVCT